jgi:ABC-type dipeptide/oligopeptide/nickel transport system ATPase component
MKPKLLSIKNLEIQFNSHRAVKGITFSIPEGTICGLIGESGSGKSVTCSAVLGLLPQSAIISGEIEFEGQNILGKAELLKSLRGKKIGYVPQSPISSLNPVNTIGSQLLETIQVHFPELNKVEQKKRAFELLDKVQLPEPEKIMKAYPFELSGGMCQRVMIALALVGEPKLIIADEPTTALDVIIQAEIMRLLLKLVRESGISLLLITHDLCLVAQSCDYIYLLKEGEIQEQGITSEVFENPQSDYAKKLLGSLAFV